MARTGGSRRRAEGRAAPVLVIHGGAGSKPARGELFRRREASLRAILAEAYPILERGGSALEAVVRAVELLEDDPLYNAGRGSKIQSDGRIRMSAGLMDGSARRFSGCVNVEGLRHPIRLALELQGARDRVLAGAGARELARDLDLEFRSPYTADRRAEFERALAGTGRAGRSGTVGAVALDRDGRLAAATSTGGRGFERPHRVSDTPTAAGTFANRACAVSATGVGEEIVEHAVAAAIAARVEGGAKLARATADVLREARRSEAQFGLIALDRAGGLIAETLTPHLVWAAATGSGVKVGA